jgi:Na+-translocating ferredoxin:NAD+ oxidoreductase RNF subunit RnfB
VEEPIKPVRLGTLQLGCAFTEPAWTDEHFPEEQIRKVLEQTGKLSPEDQLNCGACGYATCRQQAKAVLRKMAEPDMCVPYVRRLAEQRTDKIIETSPNGIVLLDMSLAILHMNSSFKKLFMCTDSVLGKPISYLMDAEPFEQIAVGTAEQHHSAVHHRKYSLVCQQIIYALPQEGQIVGLFVDLTGMTRNKQKYDVLQAQTLEQAQALLRQQMEMAGKIAEYLGSSTAQSEKLLVNLMRIAEDKKLHDGREPDEWLNDIYTAK